MLSEVTFLIDKIWLCTPRHRENREKGYRSVEYLQLCICVQAQTANTFMRFSLRMYSRRLPFEREAIQMRKYTLGRKM